jgi:hypothetical protein
MLGSLLTKSDALTPDQSQLLTAHRESWATNRLAVCTGDRATAETGVRLAYTAAGFAPPRDIVWSSGPYELAAMWEATRLNHEVGKNIRKVIIDGTRKRVDAQVRSRVGARGSKAVFDSIRSPVADAVGAAVAAAVTRSTSERQPKLRTRVRRAFAQLARFQLPRSTRPAFSSAGASPHELGWLAGYDFLREVLGLEKETELLRGLGLVAAHAGWMVPHEHVCWLSARHSALGYDDKGRLHGAKGPAVAYPDGWSHYAWKGIEIPRDAIDQPNAITLHRINEESNIIVRRCLIEIMTPQRFVAMGGACRVGQDATGVLWHKSWWTGDAWAAVEVIDGTPGLDGRRRHYFLQVPPELRTPRAAVAWSYGVTEQQYQRLGLRT